MGMELGVYTAENFDEVTNEIDIKENLSKYGRFRVLFSVLPYWDFKTCYDRKQIEEARKDGYWKVYSSDIYEAAYLEGNSYFLADLEMLKNLKVKIIDVLDNNNHLKKHFPESEQKEIERFGNVLNYINDWIEYMENSEQIVLYIN